MEKDKKENEKKVKFIMLWLILFGSGVLLANLLGTKLKGSIIDNILIGIGFLILIIGPYFLFRSKKPFLFMKLGLVLPYGGYFFVMYFLFQYYPKLSVILLPILIMLGALFGLLAAVYGFKELFKRKW